MVWALVSAAIDCFEFAILVFAQFLNSFWSKLSAAEDAISQAPTYPVKRHSKHTQPYLPSQACCDIAKRVERRLQMLNDLLLQHLRWRQVV